MIQICHHCESKEWDTMTLWCMEDRKLKVWAYIQHEDHCPDWAEGWFLSHVIE